MLKFYEIYRLIVQQKILGKILIAVLKLFTFNPLLLAELLIAIFFATFSLFSLFCFLQITYIRYN